MVRLEEYFNQHRLPDEVKIEKGKIVSETYLNREMGVYNTLANVAQILKELEAIGVYTGNIDDFPDFDEIVGREELKKVVMASVMNGKQWLDKSVANVGGVFLYGSPGGGKTHFVKAAAKELAKYKGKDKVIYLEVNNIESPYLGETENRIRRLVDKVKALREQGYDVVLVMDEVDRLAPNRAMLSGSGKRDTTNAFLTAVTELQKMGVRIFAMTNDPNMVDKAFIDRMAIKRYVPNPTYEEFKAFLDQKIIDPAIKSAIDIDTLARALADNNCSFRDAISLLNFMNVEMNFGKSPSEAAREALKDVLLGKKDQDKTFLGPNT